MNDNHNFIQLQMKSFIVNFNRWWIKQLDTINTLLTTSSDNICVVATNCEHVIFIFYIFSFFVFSIYICLSALFTLVDIPRVLLKHFKTWKYATGNLHRMHMTLIFFGNKIHCNCPSKHIESQNDNTFTHIHDL